MENIWKPRGALKSQKPDAGGAVLRNYPMLGVVKDTVDPTRSGRIRVYISALGAPDPDDEKNWTPVLYMSPFFGLTDTTGGNNNFGSFKANPASYGMWTSPPDIGTVVICLFINGDPNFGFYIGSIPDAEAMRMVPAIGANFPNEDVIFTGSEAEKYGGATRVPVTNMNTNNSNETDNPTFLNTPKPVHSFQASIMFQQGILRDPIRGPISSSSQRESPSRVGWGVSTPGRPIYQGGFTDETIADAAEQASQRSNLKIISRRGGHSIVMDDGDLIGQDNLVRIRTSLGHQILMSDDGQTLTILHSNGQSYIELGKEGTIDMYSTNSVNIRTHGDLNLHADNNININATKQLNIKADSINVESETTIKQKSGSDYNVLTQGIHTHKVDGAMSLASAGDASFASSATTYVNGSVINLNTGSTSTTPKDVESIPKISQTDTLFSSSKGWAAAPGKLSTIVSRAPAHMPWANAGQGVDVKVDLNADSQFPNSPNPNIASVNESSATTGSYPAITVSGASTVPPTKAASKALDKSTTSSLLSATAANASSGPAAAAILAGAGVVKDTSGKTTGVAVGVTGLSAPALQIAGTIKPGSAPLVDSLVQSGKKLGQAMPSNLFTGQNGVTDLPNLVNNVNAQATATVANIQQAQNLLTKTGLITGKEGPNAVAGPILSTVLNGVNQTVSTIKNSGSQLNPLQNNVVGTPNNVLKTIASGNFAANLSQNVMDGLSGISNSVKSVSKGLGGAIQSAKGLASSAFDAVTKSFKSFTPDVPQNLKAITGQNNLTASASSIASGIANLPGGAEAIASVKNNSPAALNIIPGTAGIQSLINNATTGSLNNISLNSAISASTGATNISNTLTTSLNKLKSGSIDLASSASVGLSSGAISQLNTAISSFSSGGSVPIKMPTVAINTTDRSSVDSVVGSLLPTGVPNPKFTGVPQSSITSLESQLEQQKARAEKIKQLRQQVDTQTSVAQAAANAYDNARYNLPAGDPQIEQFKAAADEEYSKLQDLLEQIVNA